MSKRCLILGGAGFIGSHLTDALLARGFAVRVFDRPNVSKDNLRGTLDRITITEGDFNNINDLIPALQEIDVVVHLICTTLPGSSNENPSYDVETNLIGTVKLLEQCVARGVKKVVFISSGGTVYGIPSFLPITEEHPTNPICSYGITKLAVEKYLSLFCHLYDLDYAVLRVSNPFGERQRIDGLQGAVTVFLGRTYFDQAISIWGDGSVARDYIHISDVMSAFATVIETKTKSKIYNIGSGTPHSLNEILTMIRKVTGKDPDITYTPGRKLDVPVNYLDITRARRELGWQPRLSLEEGMRRTWDWVKGL
jgi:UDP-glucose 4-epimerase